MSCKSQRLTARRMKVTDPLTLSDAPQREGSDHEEGRDEARPAAGFGLRLRTHRGVLDPRREDPGHRG